MFYENHLYVPSTHPADRIKVSATKPMLEIASLVYHTTDVAQKKVLDASFPMVVLSS